jgi:hypothetical protein
LGEEQAQKRGNKMINALFFDAGPIISLVMSRLDWILPELKKQYGGKFYITPAVKLELVERPSKIRRFEFEALQVMKLIREGTLEVYNDDVSTEAKKLQVIANSAFRVKGKKMDIIQSGEMESVVAAMKTGSNTMVMDERTLRLFIEDSKQLEKLLEFRFKNPVETDISKRDLFSTQLKDIKIIRSIELVSVAYKLGILKNYLPPGKDGKSKLLDAVLWATKYNGCAVTEQEINEIKASLL